MRDFEKVLEEVDALLDTIGKAESLAVPSLIMYIALVQVKPTIFEGFMGFPENEAAAKS